MKSILKVKIGGLSNLTFVLIILLNLRIKPYQRKNALNGLKNGLKKGKGLNSVFIKMKRKITWNGVLIQSEVNSLLAEYKKQEAIKLVRKILASRTSFNKK